LIKKNIILVFKFYFLVFDFNSQSHLYIKTLLLCLCPEWPQGSEVRVWVWKRFRLCARQKHRRCSMLFSSFIYLQLRQKSWLLSPSLSAWIPTRQWPL